MMFFVQNKSPASNFGVILGYRFVEFLGVSIRSKLVIKELLDPNFETLQVHIGLPNFGFFLVPAFSNGMFPKDSFCPQLVVLDNDMVSPFQRARSWGIGTLRTYRSFHLYNNCHKKPSRGFQNKTTLKTKRQPGFSCLVVWIGGNVCCHFFISPDSSGWLFEAENICQDILNRTTTTLFRRSKMSYTHTIPG